MTLALGEDVDISLGRFALLRSRHRTAGSRTRSCLWRSSPRCRTTWCWTCSEHRRKIVFCVCQLSRWYRSFHRRNSCSRWRHAIRCSNTRLGCRRYRSTLERTLRRCRTGRRRRSGSFLRHWWGRRGCFIILGHRALRIRPLLCHRVIYQRHSLSKFRFVHLDISILYWGCLFLLATKPASQPPGLLLPRFCLAGLLILGGRLSWRFCPFWNNFCF